MINNEVKEGTENIKAELTALGIVLEHENADGNRPERRGEIHCFPGEWGEPEFVVALYPWNMSEALWDLWKKIDLTNAFRRYCESRVYKRVWESQEHVMLAASLSDGREDVAYRNATIRVLNLLTQEHGLTWRFQGWDEEERLVKHGCLRAREKIVQDYRGMYVISPRCARCGEHTGNCRCFYDLNEAEDALDSEYFCEGCYEADLSERLESSLKNGKKDWESNGFIDWLRNEGIMKRNAPRKNALNHLDKVGDYIQYLSENWDGDDSYCECPIGGA